MMSCLNPCRSTPTVRIGNRSAPNTRALLNQRVERVPSGVDPVIVLVHDIGLYVARESVDLVAVQFALLREIAATRVDDNLLEGPQEGDSILDRLWPLGRGLDVEASAPYVVDGLGARAVGAD